jgi:hypothetical protein
LTLVFCAPKPPSRVIVPRLKCPRQILHLHELPDKSSAGIVSCDTNQIGAGRDEFASDPQQQRDCNGFIVTMIKWGNSLLPIIADDVSGHVKLLAYLVEDFRCVSAKRVA